VPPCFINYDVAYVEVRRSNSSTRHKRGTSRVARRERRRFGARFALRSSLWSPLWSY